MSDQSYANHPDHDKHGGNAFPFVSHGGINAHQYCQPGMTLRDWFAGQALAGICSSGVPGSDHNPVTAACDAYAYADAMLAERYLKDNDT